MDRSALWYALKLQTGFSRRVRHRTYTAVIQEPAAVEYDTLDPLLDRSLGDRLPNRLGAFDVAAEHSFRECAFESCIDARCRHQRLPAHVVDHLRVNMRDAPKDTQARAVGRTGYPLPLP